MKEKEQTTSDSMDLSMDPLKELSTLDPPKKLRHPKPRQKTSEAIDAETTRMLRQSIKNTSLAIGSEVVNRPIRSVALAKSSFSKFERIVGGREALLDALQLTPPDHAYSRVVEKFLADPGIGADPLYEIAIRNKTPLAAVVQAYRDAKAIMLNLEAVEKLAKKMPKVSEQIAEDSINQLVECVKCRGRGRVEIIEGGEFLVLDGQVATALCYECRGQGKVWKEHNIKNRQLMVDMLGMVEQKPLVQQTFNHQNNTLNANFTPGSGNVEHLMKAADKLLKGRNVQQEEYIEGSLVDRSTASSEAEGVLDSGD